jgi:hypothetical protein
VKQLGLIGGEADFDVAQGLAPGVYLCVYLGIVEIAFYDEDKLED